MYKEDDAQRRHQTPLVIAHRGASAVAPENTIAAFDRAFAERADGIEMDVRLAKNGVPVVFHDRKLKRIAGVETKVEDLTSEELSRIDIGAWFQRFNAIGSEPAFPAEGIPTLASVLTRLREFDGVIYIELKSEHPRELERLVPAVCEVVRRTPIAGSLIVKSFHLGFIPQIRHICPEIRTAALFAPKIMTILRKEKYLVDLAAEFGADELSVHYSLATKKLMKNADRRDLPVTIWTVDHPRWLKRAIKLGVKAIITNDPARLIEKRRQLI